MSVQASDRMLDYFNYGDTLTSKGELYLLPGPWSSRRIKTILQKPHYYLVMEIMDDSQQTRDLILLKDACPVGGEGSAGRAPDETFKSATDKALYPNLYTCA